MPDHYRSGSDAMAYAAAGMEPPPPVPLRKSDPVRVGPYVLVSVLGSGAMGRVYLGRDAGGGAGRAAVKVVRPEYAEDPLFRKRFDREVSALGRVQGAHTARLLGSGTDGDLLWVATEYIPGPTLAEAVDARGPMAAEAAWRLVADLARAVEAVWRQGIVHRDLKPSNVILAADGARVIDFGIVQATDATSITVTGQNVGTPAFMSPEQVRGVEVTAASDVFSLASTLAYAVAGTPPFGEGTGVDVLHRVAFDPPREEVLGKVTAADPELGAFVRACLDKDPESRPAPDEVFRTAIGHQLAAPVPAPTRPARPTRPPRPTRPARASRGSGGVRGTGATGATGGARSAGGAFAAVPPPTHPPVGPATVPGTAEGRRKRGRALVGAVAATAVLIGGGVTVAVLSGRGGPAAAGSVPPSALSATGDPAAPPGTPSASGSASGSPSATASTSKEPTAAGSTKAPSQHPPVSDLRSAPCPDEIAAGTSAACVTLLQSLLNAHGLYVPVDGDFDAVTRAAVKAFQTATGTDVDGKVGPETKRLLYGPRGPVRSGAVTVTEIINGAPGPRCLGAGADGTDVRIWECADVAKQKWALYAVPGRDAQYIVVNRGSRLCLEADSAGSGQNGHGIHGRACDGLPGQRWRLGASGPDGGQALVSLPDGFCLDAEAATSGQDGQRIQAWSCAGNGNQAWTWS
ncbi:protein kinase [Streptomyces sp. NPDC008092]|uniref:protein kinase domain-containing protein n=1 Tax=Streptomyces sp. NPDC008092 TaxID=3364808 RepID=UPI0036E94E0C